MAFPKAALPGGYDVGPATVYSSQGPVKEQDLLALTCSKCKLILREPKQVIVCGHRYCKQCIEQLTSGSDGPYTCCVDNEKFQLQEVRNDKGCLRDILGLEVDCPTQPDPCNWRGKLSEMELHKETCPNKKFLCALGCGGYYQKEDLEAHMTSACPKRPSPCKYCEKTFPLESMEDHYGVCEEYPVTCDYCSKDLPSRKQLTGHLEQECDEYYMTCPLNGCPYKGRKSDMIQHILTAHFIQQIEMTVKMQEKMNGVQEEMKTTKSQNQKLQSEVVDLQGTISGLRSDVDVLVKSNAEKEGEISRLKEIVKQLEEEREEEIRKKAPVRDGGDVVERDGGMYRTRLDTLVDKDEIERDRVVKKPFERDGGMYRTYLDTEVDKDDVERDRVFKKPPMPRDSDVFKKTGKPQLGALEPQVAYHVGTFKHEQAQLSRLQQDMETNQTQLVKMNESIHTLQESLTRYAVAIDEVRLRQDVLDVKTTHGILVWKIPDIRRRYRDAMERRTISLYSPPFYTSPHGYRMCIRTYLNGDGIGKGTHVSLFFVLMRSEHDNLLSWPFKQSVRFTLINQKNPAASITEAFVPDLHSPSFKKPENDMNIASGFPKFARQSVLQDESFTQGNVIFIKCQVDLSGLSTQ